MMALKTILFAAVCAATSATTANAEVLQMASANAFRKTILDINAAIGGQIGKRDLRCPLQPVVMQASCITAYNVNIARLEAKRVEFEAVLTAMSLPEPQRSDVLRSIYDPVRFNKERDENEAFGNRVDSLFPGGREASGK